MEPSLNERLSADLKAAMRAGDQNARDTIRFILSALKNAEIEKRGQLSPAEDLAFLQRQAKRMSESIEQFRAGNRSDLAEREAAQLEVVQRYLPAALTDDELSVMVARAIADTGATSLKDMGRVMSMVVEQAAGRADGKRLSTAVRAELSTSTT